MDGTQKRPARTATELARQTADKKPTPQEVKPVLIGITTASELAAKAASVPPLLVPDTATAPQGPASAPHIPVPEAPPPPAAAAHPAETTTPGLATPTSDAWAAFAESQAAVARGIEAFSIEMTGFARSGFSAAAETATAMLGVRTLSDAMALNAGFARQSFDALIGSSAKLSEIGVKLATEASRPLLSRFGENWKSGSIGV